jgi:hypothetical protein
VLDADTVHPIHTGGYNTEGLEALSKDLKKNLLLKDLYSDISFVFEGEPSIPAHRNVIYARAPEFLNKMTTDYQDVCLSRFLSDLFLV